MSDIRRWPVDEPKVGIPAGLSEAVLNYLPIGIAIIDQKLVLRHYNSTWVEFITRYFSEDGNRLKPGVPVLELMPGGELIFVPLFERVLTGETISQETLRLQVGEKYVYWNIILTPFYDDRGTVNIVSVAYEITKWIPTHLKPPGIRANLNEFTTLPEQIDLFYEHSQSLAVLEERNRLAQELHDNLAQAIGYLSIQLSVTNQLLASQQTGEAQAKLRDLRQLVSDIYTDVREEIFNLRSQMSPETSFLETLRQYIARYKKHYNLEVQLVLAIDEVRLELPAEVSMQLIRIIQEALINVRKHSGANKAVIRFDYQKNKLHLSVEDGGKGFDPEQMDRTDQSGFGLQIMAERAESIGGQLQLDSIPGGGVKVVIWLPMQPASGINKNPPN